MTRSGLLIKIRYSELPAGLHVRAEAEGKNAVIYLQPGLTAEQRRLALVRARSSGRLGYGPKLPAARVFAAIAVDRIRTNVRNGAAALRAHPVMFIPPMIIMVSAAGVCVLLASLSITAGPSQAGGSAAPYSVPHDHAGAGIQPGGGRPARPQAAAGGPGGSRAARRQSGPQPTPAPGPGSPYPSPAPSPDPSASGTSSPQPGRGSPPVSPSPAASGSCLKLGPLGLCVNV